ncbi:MAG: hypothetical protein OEY89_02835 [Gammaproteobacteria bacterium]|nr:hypothetical protein [Gammaproteobacteria bacterium]
MNKEQVQITVYANICHNCELAFDGQDIWHGTTWPDFFPVFYFDSSDPKLNDYYPVDATHSVTI